MNLKELEYIVKIADHNGIIRAAEELYITPSALNQQLLKLEAEIGLSLFVRTRGTGWTLTEAGRVYVDTAREMLRMKQEMYHKLQDMADQKKGTISVGFPPERGSKMFTKVYPQFHKDYPEIVVNSIEASVRRQQQLIHKGDLDIGFMTLKKNQRADDCYEEICREDLVLAVSEQVYAEYIQKNTAQTEDAVDLKDFAHIPFALMYRESTIYECVQEIFQQNRSHPKILFEATRAGTILGLVAADMCCGIVPACEIREQREGVRYLRIKGEPRWEICASWRKNTYISRPAKHFMKLAEEYYQAEYKE